MMADQEKIQTEAAAPKAKSQSGSQMLGISIMGKMVGFIVIIWLVSISYWAFGFFVAGMMPAILSMLFDRGAGRFASKTVSAFNFVGIVPFLFEIAQAFDHSLAAQRLMLDFWVWLVVYGTASLGWVTIWLFPQISMIVYAIRAESKIAKLNKERDDLVDEWGDEVKEATQFKPKKTTS